MTSILRGIARSTAPPRKRTRIYVNEECLAASSSEITVPIFQVIKSRSSKASLTDTVKLAGAPTLLVNEVPDGSVQLQEHAASIGFINQEKNEET